MTKRLMAKVGEYEKDGQTKGRYAEIGVILSNDKGEYALINPSVSLSGALTMQNAMNEKAGRRTGDRLMVSIFSDDRQGGGSRDAGSGEYSQEPAGGYGAGGSANDLDDDLPF